MFTGAVDIGSIAALVVMLSSILIVSPIFARDKALNSDSSIELNRMNVFLVAVLFTLGLRFMPGSSILPGFSETEGLLTTYALLAGGFAMFGSILNMCLSNEEGVE